MKHVVTMVVLLNFGVAGVYAQRGNVNLSLSGTAAPSPISLQKTPASEYQLTGNGLLGQFSLRVVSTGTTTPQTSTTCSGATKVFFASVAGGGVFRSLTGSLLKLNLTGGGDCIDFAVGEAVCTRVFQIIGGTNRFANASGTLTLTMKVIPVVADGPTNPVFFAVTADLTGTVSPTVADGLEDDRR